MVSETFFPLQAAQKIRRGKLFFRMIRHDCAYAFLVMCMKRLGQAAACCILIFVLVWFLADSQDVRAAASAALQLCGRSVIPSLFPFLAVSSLLISLGFGTWLAPSLSGLMTSLFGLPGQAGSALVLGLVGGYPIGAQMADDLFRAGQLTRLEA